MTQLADHIERLSTQEGSDVLEVHLEGPVSIDDVGVQGFVLVMSDSNNRVMIAELGISGDGKGLSATISTYDDAGNGVVAGILSFDNQVLVTVE